MRNSGNSDRPYFWGFQNHCRWWLQPWNKRRLLLGRKVVTNLDNILKSRDITLPTKVRLVKTMVFPNSCPLSWWCHPTISSSVVPFSSCLQSFPAPGSFLMNQFFALGGQSIGISASASVLPMNIQDWFPLGWTPKGVGSPCSPRDFQEFSPTSQFKSINSLALSFLHCPSLTSIHDNWKNHSFD